MNKSLEQVSGEVTQSDETNRVGSGPVVLTEEECGLVAGGRCRAGGKDPEDPVVTG
jgi:hypothetical protein